MLLLQMLVNKSMFNKPILQLQIILVCKLFSFWIVILLYFGKTCGLQKRKQIFQPSEWNSPPHIFSLPPEKQFTMWAVHNSYKTVIGRIWLNSSTQMKIGLGVINCNICIGSTYDCLKFPLPFFSFFFNFDHLFQTWKFKDIEARKFKCSYFPNR